MGPLSLRAGMGSLSRPVITTRGSAFQPRIRPLPPQGMGLVLLAGAIGAVAYSYLKSDDESNKVHAPLPQVATPAPPPPSLKKDSERMYMAFFVAQSESVFFRNMIYNYIRSDVYEVEEVAHFLAEYVRELHGPNANEASKGSVAKWLYALKCRSKPEYQALLCRLHKEGFLPALFDDQKFRSTYETHRIMDELKADFKELKLK